MPNVFDPNETQSMAGLRASQPGMDPLTQLAQWYAANRFGPMPQNGGAMDWMRWIGGKPGLEAGMPGLPKRFGQFGPLEEGYDIYKPSGSTAQMETAIRPGGVLPRSSEPGGFQLTPQTRMMNKPSDIWNHDVINTVEPQAQVGESIWKSAERLAKGAAPEGTRVRATATGLGHPDYVADELSVIHPSRRLGAFEPEQFRGTAPNNPDAIQLLAKMLDSLGLKRYQTPVVAAPDRANIGQQGWSWNRWKGWQERGDFNNP